MSGGDAGMDRLPTRSALVLATVLAIVATLAVGPAPQATASCGNG
jgi:hypothetical protein